MSTLLIDDGAQTVTNKTINTASNTITVVEADISDLGSYLETLVEDTTPQLGGNLDAQDNDLDNVGDIDYKTATGDVSALGNLGTTETINWNTATHFTGTLNGDPTLDFLNATSGQKITLALDFDTAQRTITWTPTIKWAGGSAPDAPSASGEELVITVAYLGTTYYGSFEIFS